MDQTSTTDILLDVQQEITLEPVSPGLRFVNFLIDLVAFYALCFIIGFAWGIVALFTHTSTELGDAGAYLFGSCIYIGYYTISEGFFGRTIGKLATRTIVLKDNRDKINFKDALLRSLCRFIPFEALSGFGYRPWHDQLTKTMVVKKPDLIG
jgi:uncharacterized RDD family membrane protein YckC